MANQGKRMVPEYLIKKIGEGGGGTEYTAGNGIDISADNEISVDTETIATKEYVDEHGGSVDIDNKTIVKNANDELETAVGGYESTEYGPDFAPVLTGTSSDWDLVDATLANAMYDALEAGKYYVELNFSQDVSMGITIKKAYIDATKDSNRWGGYNQLKIVDTNDNTYSAELYVDISSNNIHFYASGAPIYPTVGSTLEVNFHIPYEVIHKIDGKFLPDVTDKVKLGWGLYYDNNTKDISVSSGATDSSVGMVFCDTGTNRLYADLKYDGGQFYTDENDSNFAGYRTILKSSIGGGYKVKLPVDTSLITQSSDTGFTDFYETSQSDLISVVSKYIIKTIKDHMSSFINPNATFDYSLTSGIKFCNANGSTYPNFEFSVSVANDGNTVTVDAKTNTNYGTDQFVYNYSTSEIITPANCLYLDSGIYNVLQGTNPYVFIEKGEVGEIVEPIDAKFIPAINQTPTVAGTYTLQATVDAQGNVTYTWVLVTP